jgi:hypothetical protein
MSVASLSCKQWTSQRLYRKNYQESYPKVFLPYPTTPVGRGFARKEYGLTILEDGPLKGNNNRDDIIIEKNERELKASSRGWLKNSNALW